MRVRVTLASILVAIASCSPTLADHWTQTADPQVLQALGELTGLYGSYCQQGNPAACQMMDAVQQHGSQMLNAGYECQMNGNQQACYFYNSAYQSLEQAYVNAQQSLMQGQYQHPPSYYDDGTTHAQRMEQIHSWGQQRLDWGAQHSQMMDQSHERFMQTLRE